MAELINTLDTPGEFDALRMLRPDEPYFLLLGRDRLAPQLVQKWADDNRERAQAEHREGKIGDDKLERELRKSSEAEAIGWGMQEFKAGDMRRKVADEPTSKTYTGFELTDEQKRRDARQTAAVHAASALNHAAAEVFALADATEALGDTFTATGLRAEVEKLQALSDYVKPRRPSIK